MHLYKRSFYTGNNARHRFIQNIVVIIRNINITILNNITIYTKFVQTSRRYSPSCSSLFHLLRSLFSPLLPYLTSLSPSTSMATVYASPSPSLSMLFYMFACTRPCTVCPIYRTNIFKRVSGVSTSCLAHFCFFSILGFHY